VAGDNGKDGGDDDDDDGDGDGTGVVVCLDFLGVDGVVDVVCFVFVEDFVCISYLLAI